MKNEKGITLTSLVIYIIALTIIVIMFGVMRNNFENSVKDISQESNLESEFNKFNLYFTKDVKIEGNKAVLDGQNKITFSSGSSYEFINEEKNVVYKNSDKEIKILRNVNSCTFATTIDTDTAKTIITVSILFEGAESAITKEYVLLEKEDIGYQNEEEYITIPNRLPEQYTEIKYILCNGSQYINTEYVATGNLKFEGIVQTDIEDTEMAVIGNLGNTSILEIGFSSTNNRFFTWSSNSVGIVPTSSIYNKRLKFITEVNSSSSSKSLYLDIDHGLNATSSGVNNSYIGQTLQLFRVSNKYPYTGKLYYLKIFDNDVLVRYFVPCYRKSDNEIGLYDLENGVFYGNNSGVDGFTGGPEI